MRELAALVFQCGLQRGQRGDEIVGGKLNAEARGGRVGVVGRLRAVDVVIRMQIAVLATTVPELRQCDVGDHLVGVHVGRGAGAALNDVDDELVVIQTAGDVFAGGDDGVGLFLTEQAEVAVGQRRGLFYLRQCLNQFREVGNRHPGNGKVGRRTQGLDAVPGIFGYIEITKQIVF